MNAIEDPTTMGVLFLIVMAVLIAIVLWVADT